LTGRRCLTPLLALKRLMVFAKESSANMVGLLWKCRDEMRFNFLHNWSATDL
jgi:hypothetical protein